MQSCSLPTFWLSCGGGRGLRFRVWSSRFRVYVLGFRVQGL
jgi:hypothetical protein